MFVQGSAGPSRQSAVSAAHQREAGVPGMADVRYRLYVKETSEQYHVSRERKVYIIRNARIDPEWAEVERRTMSIAGRAIASLIQTQGIGDLYRIYTIAQRDGVDFNLAHIPESFHFPHREEFDTAYMRSLFETGYDLAKNGYPWKKAPPDF